MASLLASASFWAFWRMEFAVSFAFAMDIAGKVIEREISEEDHKKLIDEFIENVGEAS